jgi:hypothetical protein
MDIASEPPSMPCWEIGPFQQIKKLAWDAISSGRKETIPSTPGEA